MLSVKMQGFKMQGFKMQGFKIPGCKMLGFKRISVAALLAFGLVLCLQPAYFLAMTNLDRIVSRERTWQHIREAFEAGVLETGSHARHQFIDSGDRYTD